MAGNSSGPLFVWQHAAPSNSFPNHSVYIALLYMEKVKKAMPTMAAAHRMARKMAPGKQISIRKII